MGGSFQSLAFSSKVDRKNDIILIINKTKKLQKAMLQTKFNIQ